MGDIGDRIHVNVGVRWEFAPDEQVPGHGDCQHDDAKATSFLISFPPSKQWPTVLSAQACTQAIQWPYAVTNTPMDWVGVDSRDRWVYQDYYAAAKSG